MAEDDDLHDDLLPEDSAPDAERPRARAIGRLASLGRRPPRLVVSGATTATPPPTEPSPNGGDRGASTLAPRPDAPGLLDVGTVDRWRPGQPWWRYARPAPLAPSTTGEEHRNADDPVGPEEGDDGTRGGSVELADGGPRPADPRSEIVHEPVPSGVPLFVMGVAILSGVALGVQAGMSGAGQLLVPLAGILFALAAARRIRRLRPDEAWVGNWLIAGVVAKLLASYVRYFTLLTAYQGGGDAGRYDTFGRELAASWLGRGAAPEALPDLRRTNFVRWFTGVTYYLFGSDLLTGFFVYGLLAFVGSYLWYRATSSAVPVVNRRLYLGVVLFAPSVLFWPSSIGKESLMQLGIGAFTLGASLLLRHRLLPGFAIAAAGGWLLWVVRPHLLAMVTVAGGIAFLFGRVRRTEREGTSIVRPFAMFAVASLMVFTVSLGADFLGMEEFSLSSIESELDEQTERSSQGGSEFDSGENSLNPIYLPRNTVTVLFRPFPWEVESNLQLLASLESAVLAAFVVARFSSLRIAAKRSRVMPFLIYCWVLCGIYAMAFSAFANFGLLVRQRSLVLPALFVLLAIDPGLDRRRLSSTTDDERLAGAATPAGRSTPSPSGSATSTPGALVAPSTPTVPGTRPIGPDPPLEGRVGRSSPADGA